MLHALSVLYAIEYAQETDRVVRSPTKVTFLRPLTLAGTCLLIITLRQNKRFSPSILFCSEGPSTFRLVNLVLDFYFLVKLVDMAPSSHTQFSLLYRRN